MTRISLALLSLSLLGAPAIADCMIIKKGSRLQIWGIETTLGAGANAVEVTPENLDLYADQSKGIIESEGYDVITAKKSPTSKAETFSRAEVVRIFYTTEPDALVNAYAEMAAGNFLKAVADFKEVANDPEARDAYKYQALRQIGVCYLSAGRINDAINHYKAWPAVNARQTPDAYRLLADLLADQRKFDEARARYGEIAKLPGIPDVWKYNARLGAAKVDTAERKYDDAEKAATAVARETMGKADIADAYVLALALQAEAIWRGGKAERLPEAGKLLEGAVAIDGAEPGTRAFLLITQGNILYAQGKCDEARYPYMRAALMYPDSGYEGLAYFNAGQCFLDMSMRLDGKDQAKSDKHLVDGMKLLATAAGTYKVKEAGKRYFENKKRYDEIMAKAGP